MRSLVLLLALCSAAAGQASRACEPIRVEMCRDLGYNVTGMPNLAGHELQADADFTLQTFSPLVQYGCSAQLHVFLCSVYVPMCTEKVPTPIGPCRGLCEAVRARCYPVLQGFGFAWPAALNCSKFPAENNHRHMCMEGPGEGGAGRGPGVLPAVAAAAPPQLGPRAPCSQFARPALYVFDNRSGRCAQLCEAHVLFGPGDKRLAEVWLSVWAGACFVSSALAVLSFAVDGSRRRYPERPLAFLALCHALCSAGWGLRAAAGRSSVACAPDPAAPGRWLLAQDGLSNANCAVVFLLLYYFGTAASVWWVLVCLSWMLAAGLRWSHERAQRHSTLLHLAGWGLPAVQTVAVLVLRDVDADELTGACSVGRQNSRSLLLLVLLPQCCYLAAGCAVLVAGAARHRPSPQRRPQDAAAATTRLGVLAALYSLPASCVVASLAYELWLRDSWLRGDGRPRLWVFLLRLFMSMVAGVTALVWVWSPKTLRAWRVALRSFGPYRPAPVKCLPIQYYPPQPLPLPRARRKKRRSKHGSETTV
ncbi:frizzled-4-like [Bacillus rossius redtenbacheri]|uniref:frizzled-4-like n=1 Tax=Bacillus rossius redtenbacheri TaxID=93214 RepID=UPI002FDE4654